jgi:hypothetical protein
MRDQPTGEQLLDTARSLLRDELLPALPADKRHAALMIANAMAIASRQLKAGDAHERRELVALGQLLSLPSTDAAADDAGLRAQLVAANRVLCARLREGRADHGAMRAQVLDHLQAVTRRKVEESNPKYLASMPRGDNP